jgi:GT2 family glycosyltransferase
MAIADSLPAPGAAAPSARPRTVAIVLNWRRPDETLACLRSLLASDYPNLHVLVVDNSAGSSGIDDLLAGLPAEILRSPHNLGFTGGVNLGIHHALAAGTDYVWLVNSDATVAPDALGRLVAAAEADLRIGLVSPVFHDPERTGTPVFCLALQPADNVCSEGTADPEQARAWLRQRPGQVVLYGAALLIRRTLIDTIGTLDDRFFAYAEDVDYCLRCHDAGYRPAVCFDAVAYHQFKDLAAADVAPYVHYFVNRNQALLWRKRGGLLRRPTVWYLHQRLLGLEAKLHDRAAVDAMLLGLWDGLRGVGGPPDLSRRPPAWLRYTVGRHPRPLINLLERKPPWRRPARATA